VYRSPAPPYIPDVLETIGLDAELGRAVAGWAAATDASVGRVVRVDRGLVSVLTEDGIRRASVGGGLLGLMAHDPTEGPCTGDWCLLRTWPDHRTTLERLLPRRTVVTRATAGRQSRAQVLCSNIDIAALVVALHPLPVLSKVERLVALAWESGARPLVLLTKSDLVTDADQVADDAAAATPGVDVAVVSARTGEGVDGVRKRLEGRLSMALLGTSGHGKSSLVNALVGAETLATRTIREDGRGRHTSVRRELVPLPGGGAVIDTPGLRGVGLVDAELGLEKTFGDVQRFAARCRFGDCAHQGEPGCEVVRAVQAGELSSRRFESWLHLQRELRSAASRTDARLRAERTLESGRRIRAAKPPRGRPDLKEPP
jgi:ribosome biogenesis GTPase / thiamine phosphate phosphatase